jgi:hypothetical protein
MRQCVLAAILMAAVCGTVSAKDDDKVTLAKDIIKRENERLQTEIGLVRNLRAAARMGSNQAKVCAYSIKKMEATIALNILVIEQGKKDVLIATAKAICLADLERNSRELCQTPVRERFARLEKDAEELARQLEALEK